MADNERSVRVHLTPPPCLLFPSWLPLLFPSTLLSMVRPNLESSRIARRSIRPYSVLLLTFPTFYSYSSLLHYPLLQFRLRLYNVRVGNDVFSSRSIFNRVDKFFFLSFGNLDSRIERRSISGFPGLVSFQEYNFVHKIFHEPPLQRKTNSNLEIFSTLFRKLRKFVNLDLKIRQIVLSIALVEGNVNCYAKNSNNDTCSRRDL